MKWVACLLGAWIAFVSVGIAQAADAEEPSPWHLEFVPYVWIPGTFSTVDVQGNTVSVAATVHDALVIATDGNGFAGSGYLGLQYDRWSTFVDAFGGYAEIAGSETVPTQFCKVAITAKADLRETIVDFAVGYRLGQWSLPTIARPLSLGVYAGMRYMHFGVKANATLGVIGGLQHAGAVSDTFNWADPMIGVRWEVPLHEQVTLDFRGDIGGFGVSSNLIWGMVGDLRYWPTWKLLSAQPWIGAGYRIVSFDRGSSSENIDMVFRGPYAGVGFVF